MFDMNRKWKKMTAAAMVTGLSFSMAFTAQAKGGVGPGYEEAVEEEVRRSPLDPDGAGEGGRDQDKMTGQGEGQPEGDQNKGGQNGSQENIPGGSQPDNGQAQDGAGQNQPDQSQPKGGAGQEGQPAESQVTYPEGMVPNTMKNGGNIDLTPTNEAAIWDAVEVYGQQANYPTQYTWLSAKLKEGYNGKLSYRPFVNHGGWLKFYSDGEPAGGTEGSTYVEAIQMHLTGEAAQQYDLYYAVSTANRGQLGFAAEGEIAGAMNVGDSITDLKVVLVPKGSGAPASTADRYFNEFSGRIGFTETAAICVNEDGVPYTGWADYDMKRYYFQDGRTLSGWHYIDGFKFFFEENGQLRQDVDDLIGRQDSYHIRVNKTLNCLTVYAADGENGYIIPVKAMLTSVGDDTPIGTFTTPEKYRWRLMINDTYTQYATRIKAGAGFLFHSITYETTNPHTLNTNGYNGLGVVRSAGCIRLTCGNAKWIYDNCKIGTQVTIYEDAEVPSPFMKPYVVPIPNDQRFDPSDPNVQ